MRLARNMMATRFELVLRGENKSHLQALGEAAFDEIGAIERRFSYYRSNSELSLLNQGAFEGPVSVAPDFLDLLKSAKDLFTATGGAFDPTIGPLMKLWAAPRTSLPAPEEIADALSRTGMHHVHIDSENSTISYAIDGLEIDLGGIAKGYAIEMAMEFLIAAGVENILLHGGTSTVATLGTSFEGLPWKIGISDQQNLLATIELVTGSLSVSAQSGKMRIMDDRLYGHIVDPANGHPVSHTAVAAVVCPLASECDALSTAALVLGGEARHSNPFSEATHGVAVWQPSPMQPQTRSQTKLQSGSGPPRLVFQSGLPEFLPQYPEGISRSVLP